MHDPPSRRGFLRAALALGTAAAAGCSALPPSDDSGQSSEKPTPTEQSTPTEQPTPTPEPTQTPTEEPSLPELGTDFETDVSGDGIPDLLVERIADNEDVDEVNPYRKNVFVEVDRVEGVAAEETLSFARSVFADAPVENPDGSTGIDVHFVVDEPIPEAESNASVLRDYHFGRDRTSVFERRHRGFRHLVVLDDLSTGWYADPWVLAVESGRSGRLVDALAAHLAGRFDPLLGAESEGPGDAMTDQLWLPGAEDATADQLHEAIDWDLVAEHLPATTPSLHWYERKYAHLPEDSEVPPPDATEDDLGPAVGEPEKDTSGDGFTDRELLEADAFAELDTDPLRKNVFVEVDYQQGLSRDLVEKRMQEIQAVFANGPVRNPDGSMGIDVHYVISDEITFDGSVRTDDLDAFRTEYFDHLLEGFFYMIFVDDVEDDRLGNLLGVAGHQGNLIFTQPSPSTPLHELGHSLGLYATRPGVDQREYSFREYPSAMNYNSPRHALVFASEGGDPITPNDWAIMERLLSDEQPNSSLLL